MCCVVISLASGAAGSEVLLLFLIEAVTLSCVGGSVGKAIPNLHALRDQMADSVTRLSARTRRAA